MDIIINIRTTYFDEKSDEIINTKKIATKYLRSFSFLIDVVSTLPFD